MARKKNTKKQEQKEQEALENKEEVKEEEQVKDEEQETKEELYKVEVKISKKGVEKFYRAGFKFTVDWQELELTKEQLERVKNEKMLTFRELD